MPEIGQIQEVDIRELWPNEAADFTPWLAYQGGLELLGSALLLAFTSASHEVPAGKFRADVVCKEVSNPDRPIKVVIENQLDELDHGHVGQALVYANTLKAGICIWVAEQFTREHRAFVESQNATPDREVDCYCIQVSAFKVDDSKPVPKFKVVVRPDPQVPAKLRSAPMRVASGPKPQRPMKSDIEVINEFMDKLKFELTRAGYSTEWGKSLKDKPRHLLIDIGHRPARIAVAHESGATRVRLHMFGKGQKALYYRFIPHKESIEKDIGANLQWPTSSSRSSIDLRRDVNLADISNWDEQITWCLSKVDLFLEVFNWRLEALKRGESIDPSNKPEAQRGTDAVAG